MKQLRYVFVLLGFLVITTTVSFCYTLALQADGSTITPPQTKAPAHPDRSNSASAAADDLPVIGSYTNLKSLLAEVIKRQSELYDREGFGFAVPESTAAGAPASAPYRGVNGSADFSATNVQVAGVDEADMIKTDGTYIYQVRNGEVTISKAYPAKEMAIVKQLGYDSRNFNPIELYVDSQHLVVIGETNGKPYLKKPASLAHYTNTGTVKAVVYDITDKANIKQVRELELEGSYVTSRKIGSSLYFVSNLRVNVYSMNDKSEVEPPLPVYRDTLGDDKFQPIPLDQIRYFPRAVVPSYLLVGGIDLSQPKQKLDVASFLAAGDNVYASDKHLYVTVTLTEEAKTDKDRLARRILPSTPIDRSSAIHKFALKAGRVSYVAKGEVPGTILNQFSLDEHDGFLRIATTTGEIWRDDERTSKNNLYVLDDKLAIKGKLEGIAPGEKIYSARFIGDRAYMVTFKTVDPLFVIDLKKPESPTILGALKIPGYSDYLHPYDENHIIGFGKDTEESAYSGDKNMAFYQGMKIAMFDVSDVAHPKEQFKEIIGDRGTDSELLDNHKALLFSKEKHLLAFPVTVMEIKRNQQTADAQTYGEFAFQGAYIYDVSLEKGFTLRKKITHLSEEQQLKAGSRWFASSDNINRILYINDVLYTLSPNMIKAFSLDRLEELKQLPLD